MKDQDRLTLEERSILLSQARLAIQARANDKPLQPLALEDFPAKLRKPGVVFVTLTIEGNLRGCVGALEAYQPLLNDVREHALAAAFQDFRFPPVRPDELDNIVIEISRLTAPQPLAFVNTDDLLKKLRPGIDGVVLKDGLRRATFLPQVWEKLPSPEMFLDHLCQKMGVPANLWRQKKLEVLVYQVEEFHE
jgi:AmmeMemoRadiSam system protein A